MFDVFYIGKNDDLKEHLPHATQVNSLSDIAPLTMMYWVIDPCTKVLDYDVFKFRPAAYDQKYIHVWKYDGGIRLVPARNNAGEKHIDEIKCRRSFDILRSESPKEYFDHNPSATHVWCIDPDYVIDENSISWCPDYGDNTGTFIFKIPGQLEHKYPPDITAPWDNRCGGIKLYSNNANVDKKFIGGMHVSLPSFPVFRTTDPSEVETDADFFWCIDPDYEFAGEPYWIPEVYDKEYIHVFKLPGFMEHRYPPDITAPWDNRCGGIKLYPKDYDLSKQKYQENTNIIKFDVFYTDNLLDYKKYQELSTTEMFWLIDDSHVLPNEISWVPHVADSGYINIFKVPGQLEHKYPPNITNVSDNRCGGIRLIPRGNIVGVKYQGTLNVGCVEYEQFESVEIGKAQSKNDWFWVISNSVTVLPNFEFSYIPEQWDWGKTHIWQRLNPKTGIVYDQGGVELHHKNSKTTGRPKYIKMPACEELLYPVYHVPIDAHTRPLQQFYEQCAASTIADMYYVVDTFTCVHSGFKFDYYPTQYDKHCVHVFADESGQCRNVRLVPRTLFLENQFTDEEIANNSFQHLKLLTTNVASELPRWPVFHIPADFTVDDFRSRVYLEKQSGSAYFWTIDNNVFDKEGILRRGFMPSMQNLNKVHVWQKENAVTNKVCGYGGLRLWPTNRDYSKLTSEDFRLNRIRDLEYVRGVIGCTVRPYDVFYLSYHEENADKRFKSLEEKLRGLPGTRGIHHIKDEKGIFNAHKLCAEIASTNMFWVVDADAEVVGSFDFSYIPDVYDEDIVHVWHSKNPINGLEYGYGGIKLFPTRLVKEATSWGLDFTTGLSSRFKSIPEVSCITRFNTGPFETWRSAFRECVKLLVKDDNDSRARFDGWATSKNFKSVYSAEATRGALDAKNYMERNRNNITELGRINDYDWLREHYTSRMG